MAFTISISGEKYINKTWRHNERIHKAVTLRLYIILD